ncbi:efflux RND transporter periplasmic adaptor subunit [Leptolyngbya sp. 15MV]|nr:efflux RND transporter periplasmic adaptor subunit [Leptolyngbya sp. 15MV]
MPVQLRLLDEAAFHHRGRMEFVDSAFDARSGTIRGRAVVPNPDLFLTPGSFARLRLHAGESDALMVPDAAVLADQSGRVVLTVAPDGTVTPRPVQLGPLIEGLRVVRTGLAPEDRVIIGGLHHARPGTRVTAEQGRIGPSPLAAAP